MSIFKKTAENIARKILNNQLKKQHRRVEFHNMKSARHIGILFDTNQKENNKIVSDFYKDLKSQGYQVNAAGWYTGDDIPQRPLNTLDFIYFSDQDSNWKGIPQTHEISEFFKQKFDILFVLTQSEELPVQYIVSLSKSAFKVGANASNKEHLDFMIELKEQSSIQNLIQDSINYLSEIKKN
ncbi:hypothetical protein EO244_09270 [Ancylomarina salipaludis]|uniref:Uncharacterized protein n=1 Tax=Ancylomarina salipaludis TaxID=2501299 RepID=A0A4Q1JLK1_9BACT|nr:hypothetical protein [Ancylomarina salipaludis]RXQ94462.1 hypothetical protein EO244_09270 [Ancylomarina salipaludis]